MHNPSIGRFFNVDPLASDYVYNSHYAFSENRLGLGVELEGTEVGLFPWLTSNAANFHYTHGRGDGNIGAGDYIGGVAIALTPAGTFTRGVSATTNYVGNEIDYALNVGNNFEESASQGKNFTNQYETKKFKAKVELLKVGVEATTLAVGGAQASLEGALLKSSTNTLGKGIFGSSKSSLSITKTGGRLGNSATRKQIAEISTTLEGRGYTITGGGGRRAEEFLRPLGGGRKGGSFLDITATNPQYGTLRINTVDILKDGLTPSAREFRNALRIRTQIPANEHLLLIPKK